MSTRRQRRETQQEELKTNQRLARWGSSPDGQKQLIRYSKTFAWALRRTKDELNNTLANKYMVKYPVNARDLKEAIADLDDGTLLSTSDVSNTDKYAIEEALRHVDKQTAKELVYKTSEKEKTLWDKIRYFFYLLFRKTN
jgi:hypothetical protein